MGKLKNISTWLIYDFGNSFFVTAISGLFLTQWLILDNKLPDIWYGGGFAIATVFVLISSPFLGAWSDRVGRRMPFLKWASIGLFIINGLMAFVADSNLSSIERAFIVLVLSIIVQYLYQISLIFYNSLLKVLSTDQTRGKISGLGEAFNNLGWLLGSIVLLPFATGAITLIGSPGRAQVFLPAFVISTLLMLPMLLLFRESRRTNSEVTNESTSAKTIEGIKSLFKGNRNVGIFLIAFALISDIVLTLNLYFAVVANVLYKINDTMITILFGINLISAMILGYFLGKLGDKYGHKPIAIFACFILIIFTSIFFLSSSLSTLYFVAVLSGAGTGGYYVVTRSLMIKISPKGQLGEYFGFYSTFQRFASVVAPLVWGGITLVMINDGPVKYQTAGLTMVALLIVGTIVLFRVKETK